MNKVGKNNIMDAFELRFKKGFSDWKRDYKNKYDILTYGYFYNFL